MRARRFSLVAILVGAAVCAISQSQDASSERYLVVSDGDSSGNALSTVMKLSGTMKEPVVKVIHRLDSGESAGGGAGNPSVQAIAVGSDLCVFMTDGIDNNGDNEVSAFKYPGLTLVGSYSDSNIPVDYYPDVIVASGGYLFVGFSHYISSWAIESGCLLSLLQTTYVKQGSIDLAATPDGSALIGTDGTLWVDSYAIGPNGILTELGPYATGATNVQGLDITADSKYAVFATIMACQPQCYTSVMVVAISPDGSLSEAKSFGGDGSLGYAYGINFVRLSPNEKFLYASGYGENGIENQIITLTFTESPLDISYGGCTTTLRLPPGPVAYAMATAATTGAGSGLYVAETNGYDSSSVALLAIKSETGCTTEVSKSPFSIEDHNSSASFLTAWPPRPF